VLHTKINPAKERTNNNSPRSLFLSILLLTKRLQFPSPYSSFRLFNQATDPKLKKILFQTQTHTKNFKTKKYRTHQKSSLKTTRTERKKEKQTNKQTIKHTNKNTYSTRKVLVNLLSLEELKARTKKELKQKRIEQ